MKILLVAATAPETAFLRERLGIHMTQALSGPAHVASHTIEILHTGIGMVNTAYHMGKYLSLSKPDLVFNIGIAGSFSRGLSLGEIVEVESDTFAELGAEDENDFLDLEALGFPLIHMKDQVLYNRLENPFKSDFGLKKVAAITVNRVHGHPRSIEAIQSLWPAEIESMEGAAFFHAMLQEENIPFYAIRSISNYVELRDKSKWDIPGALISGQKFVWKYLEESLL